MNAPYKIMKNTLLKLTTNNQYIKTNCSHCSSSLTPILPRVCMQHHPLNDALDGSPLTISVHRYVFLLVCSKLEVPLSNYRSMLSVPQKKSRKQNLQSASDNSTNFDDYWRSHCCELFMLLNGLVGSLHTMQALLPLIGQLCCMLMTKQAHATHLFGFIRSSKIT